MKYLFLSVMVICFATSMTAQTTYQVASEESAITINGTSTIKKWHCDVIDVTGQFTLDAEGKLISDIDFSFDATTIKSMAGGEMDKKTYKALKTEEYPQITFVADQAQLTDNGFVANGTFSIAGVSQEVEITGLLDANEMTLSGATLLKFSQFEIEPPSAMFGTIVCRDDLNIEWTMKLTQNVN